MWFPPARSLVIICWTSHETFYHLCSMNPQSHYFPTKKLCLGAEVGQACWWKRDYSCINSYSSPLKTGISEAVTGSPYSRIPSDASAWAQGWSRQGQKSGLGNKGKGRKGSVLFPWELRGEGNWHEVNSCTQNSQCLLHISLTAAAGKCWQALQIRAAGHKTLIYNFFKSIYVY